MMENKNQPTDLQHTSIRWDLTSFYKDIHDPQIKQDQQTFLQLAESFSKNYKGQLSQKLGDSLRSLMEIEKFSNKLMVFFHLKMAQETGNQEYKKVYSQLAEKVSEVHAENFVFFDLELGRLSEEDYQRQLQSDPDVKFHQSFLDHIRKLAKHNLSEDVEKTLALRAPFGSSEWDDLMEEWEGELTFDVGPKKILLTEALHLLSEEQESTVREKLIKTINDGLQEQKYNKLRARALNMVMGEKMVSDKQRGYATPMSARNLSNKIDDQTVEALHTATKTEGAKQAQRFYKLKAKILGKDKLLWSDRNAPMPFEDASTFSWPDGMKLVKEAYASFSPTLVSLIEKIEKHHWIDAPVYPGKRGGAFNYSIPLPHGSASYNLLNYMGSKRDVMTVAHELGHGVHGLLAIEAQGPLMWHAPMAYAETASIFGEMIVFQFLMNQTTDPKKRLAMLMDKISDFMNSVVRQISFSLFEQETHLKRRSGKLMVEDFNKIWMDVTYTLYGKDQEVFAYKDMDSLWCYVSHFMSPFYTYAYAFGELFTQSLFAVKDSFGKDFEPMYLDLLRAGGTKNAVQLMKPFDLNPNAPTFWTTGIAGSVGKWLDEAEKLFQEVRS